MFDSSFKKKGKLLLQMRRRATRQYCLKKRKPKTKASFHQILTILEFGSVASVSVRLCKKIFNVAIEFRPLDKILTRTRNGKLSNWECIIYLFSGPVPGCGTKNKRARFHTNFRKAFVDILILLLSKTSSSTMKIKIRTFRKAVS